MTSLNIKWNNGTAKRLLDLLVTDSEMHQYWTLISEIEVIRAEKVKAIIQLHSWDENVAKRIWLAIGWQGISQLVIKGRSAPNEMFFETAEV